MEKINKVKSPIVGKKYLVKCVSLKRNNKKFILPVVGNCHNDGKHGNSEMHYHIDLRFLSNHVYTDHRVHNFRRYGVWNGAYFSPIMKNEIVKEFYTSLTYNRDFEEFPSEYFTSLQDRYKDVKMKNMICPHQGTNLTSCKPINNIVTCPCHGLKWDILTGELIKEVKNEVDIN